MDFKRPKAASVVSINLWVAFLLKSNPKLGQSLELFLAFITSFSNIALCWFFVAFSFNLYKQARKNTNFEKKSNLLWVWITTILGWMIFFLILFLSFRGILGLIRKKTSTFRTKSFRNCSRRRWAGMDSNHRPLLYKSSALTAELPARKWTIEVILTKNQFGSNFWV